MRKWRQRTRYKKKATSGKELWGEAQAHVEEEDGKADVRSWVEGGRSGRYQPGARRPIPGSVVTGESESEEPLGPAKWAPMTRLVVGAVELVIVLPVAH